MSTTVRMVEASPLNDVEARSRVQTSAVATPSPKSPPTEAVQMPNLDSFAAKLNNFSVVLSEKAKSRIVTVGNVGEIESAIDMKKVRHSLFLLPSGSLYFDFTLNVGEF